MASANAKTSVAPSVDELLASMQSSSTSTEARQTVKDSSAEFANIEANPFFEVAFREDADPNEQMKEIAAVLTAAKTKTARREAEAAAVQMLSYLQSVREEMAKDSIRLSDPKNFGVVRDTLDSMGGVMNELFDKHLTPLTDLIDVFDRLNVSDKALDIYAELENDRVAEEKATAERAALAADYEARKANVDRVEREIAAKSNEKNFFGGIKKEAQAAISQLEIDLANVRRDRDAAGENVMQYDATKSVNVVTGDADLIEAKRKLRDFLATTSEGHEQAGMDLITSAINAIEESKTRTGTIKVHLSSMKDQIEVQDDTATKLTFTYGLLEGGMKIAQDENLAELSTFDVAKENETAIDRLQRETKKTDLNEYIGTIDRIKTNVNSTVLDLATDTINIKNMRANNLENLQTVEEMHTRGVATIASSLATTVNALGSTALAQSSNIAANIIETAQSRTDRIATKQLVKTAGAVGKRNEKMVKAVESLKQFAAIRDKAAEIQRAGMVKMNATNAEMERLARTVSESLSKTEGMTAEILSGSTASTNSGETKTTATKRPF